MSDFDKHNIVNRRKQLFDRFDNFVLLCVVANLGKTRIGKDEINHNSKSLGSSFISNHIKLNVFSSILVHCI